VSRFEEAIEVEASAERTFEFAANPRHLSRIDPSASVRLLSGGWTDVGSRHHVTNRYRTGVVDSVHEITRYEPPRLAEERVTMRTSVMLGQTEVRSIGPDRSVVIVRGEIDWGRSFLELVNRLLEPLWAPPMRRRALRRIKAVIESMDEPSPETEPHLPEKR
jgi:polyketide cyclase/dehydrase/lipid transport protein